LVGKNDSSDKLYVTLAGTNPPGAVTISYQSTKCVETLGVFKDTVRLFCTILTVSQSIRSEIIYKGRYKILSIKLQYLTSTTNQIHGLGSTASPETFSPKFTRIFGVRNRKNKIKRKIKT